jgi:hypothetical protein
MKRLPALPLLLLVAALSAVPAWATPPSESSMETLMESSGYRKTMQSMMDRHMLAAKTKLMLCNPPLSDKAIEVAVRELRKEFDTVTQKLVSNQMAYFADHMTQEDVDELIGIYRSPVWKKQAAVMRQYQKDEYSRLVQGELPKLFKEIADRVSFRLRNQGLAPQVEKEQ